MVYRIFLRYRLTSSRPHWSRQNLLGAQVTIAAGDLAMPFDFGTLRVLYCSYMPHPTQEGEPAWFVEATAELDQPLPLEILRDVNERVSRRLEEAQYPGLLDAVSLLPELYDDEESPTR
jgi:hypothetical protein